MNNTNNETATSVCGNKNNDNRNRNYNIIYIYIYIYIYNIYIYVSIICNHENNAPSLLSPQWLCGNPCTWAHNVVLQNVHHM